MSDHLTDYDLERMSYDPPAPRRLCCRPYWPAGPSAPYHSEFCSRSPNVKLTDADIELWRTQQRDRKRAAERVGVTFHDPATCEGTVCDSCNPVDDDPPYDEQEAV